jgi:hypothetical protein
LGYGVAGIHRLISRLLFALSAIEVGTAAALVLSISGRVRPDRILDIGDGTDPEAVESRWRKIAGLIRRLHELKRYAVPVQCSEHVKCNSAAVSSGDRNLPKPAAGLGLGDDNL